MALLSYFAEKIIKTFPKPQCFLIGVSGGLDSMVLLNLFHQFCQQSPQYSFRALHVHHGISPFANDWLSFCVKHCNKLDIPLITEKVTLPNSGNLEANARQMRYLMVEKHLQPQEIFVTAHHQDDQVETFFLALKRGSGLTGLSAMSTLSKLGEVKIFRPLLGCSRQKLEKFARDQKLEWINDESNDDLNYDRNFLRHQGLNELRSRWQYFDQMVARAATLCGEQQELLEELLCSDFRKNFHLNDQSFDLCDFKFYSKAKQNALLRMWLQHLNHPMPSVSQLNIIKNEVIYAPKERNPQFQYSGKVIRRYQNKLYLTAIFNDLSHLNFTLSKHQHVILPDDLGQIFLDEKGVVNWQREEKIVSTQLGEIEEVEVRFHYAGKVKKTNGQHEIIKKCWQKHRVPPWQRTRIPLIFINGEFHCALGYFSSAD